MPVIKVDGYKIRRSKGGLYPKVYSTRGTAEKRVSQMEFFKHRKNWKPSDHKRAIMKKLAERKKKKTTA